MSSSDIVISVENLSKRYLVGHNAPTERYHSLRDTVVRHGKNFARKTLDMARGRQIIQGDSVEEFWALKDVSFEVKRGEVLGIIGRNGAGKSTLLKILSRITEPTEGRVRIRGRVASLLEVGTGFHPELSGRENIFLNGAILGMTRAEIRKKFDEIVEFAGVEKFLDTPVKRYSSGMYVRLAFAVAAHLEPEILIVDEVLAVGDAEFQKKCLGKMKEVTDGGRTVLFVSHNLAAVRSLCSHGLLLTSARLSYDGTIDGAVATYESDRATSNADLGGDNSKPRMTHAELNLEALNIGRLTIKLRYESPTPFKEIVIGVVISDELGTPIAGHNTWMDEGFLPLKDPCGGVLVSLNNLNLHPGNYNISLFLGDQNENYHTALQILPLSITGDPLPRTLSRLSIGSMRVEGHWTHC